MIIAIDGPAAAGKGTLARRLAAHYNLAYLDTGSLYRATGLRIIRSGARPDDPAAALAAARRLEPLDLTDPRLRDEDVSEAASVVAALAEVRQALLDFQRSFARQPPTDAAGAVLDGRDIGTVVCPDADIKLFVTASLQARALRRVEELKARDQTVIYQTVLEDMAERDRRDSLRATAPLTAASGAFVMDTTHMDADQAFAAAAALIDRSRRLG